jgi:hypothetical protein
MTTASDTDIKELKDLILNLGKRVDEMDKKIEV